MNKDEKSFYCGFAAALADLSRTYHRDSEVKHIMSSNGVTLKMLKEANVEAFDLDVIAGCL